MLYRNCFLIFSLLSMSLTGIAQEPCATHSYTQKWLSEDPTRVMEIESLEKQIQKLSREGANNRFATIIPVVVHVIHKGENIGVGTNVSDARIDSQIEILNEDFQRMNGDAGETPSAFAPLAANVGVQFCLANIDASGHPTDGITRHFYSAIPNADFIESSIKPNTTWNPDKYLNIWVLDHPTGNVLGYAYLPTTTMVGSNRDGVVIDYLRFGYIGPTNRGRTCTHEVGHYLGLNHTWGSNNSSGPIGCNSDDGIDDTPNSDAPYYNCPNSGWSCGTDDMHMNFMDYTDDHCMNLFTTGQANVMQGILNGIRSELITGNLTGCSGDCKLLEEEQVDHGFEPSQNNAEWTIINANNDDRTWSLLAQSDDDWGPNQGSGMAVYFWSASSTANDYLYTPCLDLIEGHEYTFSFSYACSEDDFNLYPEKFKVGFSRTVSSVDFIVPDNSWVFDPVTNAYPSYEDVSLSFVADETKTTSIGFHIFSDADQYALLIDDIRIEDSGLVGTNELQKGALKVFPNPANGYTTLSFEAPLSEDGQLEIYSMEGKEIHVERLLKGARDSHLSLKGLKPGIYMLKCSFKLHQWVERLVIIGDN
ncbi:MAG: T9SS type A sorting domain-containing protein [Saprospiraceae bacterium]|nr:T9SS type A sorting domain-containing protein [Saprospiraceae bacterium]